MTAVALLVGMTANAQRKTVVTTPVQADQTQQDGKFIKPRKPAKKKTKRSETE